MSYIENIRPCGGCVSLGDCRKALNRLEDYLDRDLTPDERVSLERHLSICDQCTKEFGMRSRAQRVLREKLTCEKCPDELRKGISDLLRDADA
ncbi:MAG TPA: zf-HC2 domain-containing protein [Armatimonadota bacterium]